MIVDIDDADDVFEAATKKTFSYGNKKEKRFSRYNCIRIARITKIYENTLLEDFLNDAKIKKMQGLSHYLKAIYVFYKFRMTHCIT